MFADQLLDRNRHPDLGSKLYDAIRCSTMVAVLLLVLTGGLASPSQAQTAAAKEEVPPKVSELLNLLADPGVQKWLEAQKKDAKPATAPAQPANDVSGALAARIAAIRGHLAALGAALPGLPAEFAHAADVFRADLQDYGLIEVVALLALFTALGFGGKWLYHRLMAGFRRRIEGMAIATVHDRLLAIAARFLYGAGHVAAFAIGSIGAFFVFNWPILLEEIVLAYLVAFLMVQVARVVLDFLLSPAVSDAVHDAGRFRVLPMSDEAAAYWSQRLRLAVGWYAFGYATVAVLWRLGFSLEARHAVAYALGLGLLAIGIEMVWRRPHRVVAADAGAREWIGPRTTSWLISIYFAALWLLWVAGAMRLFWLAVVAAGLPAAFRLAHHGINHVLRRGVGTGEAPSVAAAAVDRGIRVALIGTAVLLLAWAWDIDLGHLSAADTLWTRLVRGALSAVVVLLVADFAWHVAKTAIDRRMAVGTAEGDPGSDEGRRRARLRTLLPILRNILLVTLVVVAVLMALAALGVEIGPLIAGAGVVGVAIGFGAQTVVKDIISGMFYLLDDAFRVGEYIESGSHMGTVESFSLRSVKLRHHRGPIYTIPFSDLGAVQNHSRDWVIEKIRIGITYDSDIEKARKLIKQVGQELAQDPDFGPLIIKPPKMQGVDKFTDYAIQISLNMTTKPGEQYPIKRRALFMIKKAFDENGIKFASPTVQVAGGGDAAAAAQQAIAMQHAAANVP